MRSGGVNGTGGGAGSGDDSGSGGTGVVVLLPFVIKSKYLKKS